ncbi:hypothetical protein EWM64_g656 [Hericium alpestre]|uniref:Carboxypeptidase n=1 Tax=Hericium alpestre TaxID=135208 RepID=A0A4Z0ABG9_9AGAM|nr:hypothetical protein EWM64_g656 [Hericium alpestre]
MAGESYGGRYLPLFASAIYDQNAALEESMRVNLSSVLIGNGLTDMMATELSYYTFACTSAPGVPPVLDISTCARMSQVKRCETVITEACVNVFDSMNCRGAYTFCSSELEQPMFDSGLNPYDVSRPCEGDIADTLCYPITKVASQYLSDPELRATLGVDPAVPETFAACSDTVGNNFGISQDTLHSSVPYVAALLERGVRVLLYVGEYDWICNWVGNERWSLAMEWSGHDAFNAQELKPWLVDGKVAGKTRSAHNLTFATVAGAGHMVPYNKPKEALALVNLWLAGKVPA